MNPGIGEEATRGFLSAMKDQPLSLALVVMNLALLVLLFYVGHSQAEYRSKQLELIFEQTKENANLLARCQQWLPR